MSKAQWLEENLRPGEQYVGILLGKDGALDYHVFCRQEEAENVNWEQAVEWAKSLASDLPTRREQALLFANLKEWFKPTWYWSGEQYAANPDNAWCQGFNNGLQYHSPKSSSFRARAVRRLAI